MTPESAGVPSSAISAFLNDLRENHFNMHSVLIMRNGSLIAEAYAPPYDKDRKHRMYSVSKTFTALAAGLMIDEGRLSLDDKIYTFFPEYCPGGPETLDPLLESATVYDMLTMQDCHDSTSHGIGIAYNWLESWFITPPSHPAGIIFNYNTTSTNLIAAIVERLSGVSMMEYLYPRLLDPIGFSPGCYCLPTPDGDSFGGSGVMCTPRDLAKLAQLVMNGGAWDGKQLISENFIKMAVSAQADTSLTGSSIELQNGYGFYIWRLRHNGFAFFGIFSQIAAGFPDNRLLLVTTGNTADLYDGDTVITNIMERFYRHILPFISDRPLPEDETALNELKLLLNLPQMTAPGLPSSPFMTDTTSLTYHMRPNEAGWRYLKFNFLSDGGTLEYTNRRGTYVIPFGFGHNKPFVFKDFSRLFGNGPNECEAHASAGWINEHTLAIYIYCNDEEEAYIKLNAAFISEKIVLYIKSTNGILRDYANYIYGLKKTDGRI